MAKIKTAYTMDHPETARSDLPKPGTKVRAAYDLFKASPGVVIDFVCHDKHNGILRQLRDTYGLDIASAGVGKRTLVGEYVGADYISYKQEK